MSGPFDPITIVEEAWNSLTEQQGSATGAQSDQEWDQFWQAASTNPDTVMQSISAAPDEAAAIQYYQDQQSQQSQMSAVQWGLIAGGSVLALLLIYEATHGRN